MMLTPLQLEEIQNYVLANLPKVLEQDPRFVYVIEGIVNDKFPRKSEFAELVMELRQEREERSLENRQIRQEVRTEISALRTEMKKGFDRVDQQFEKMDQRFEKVDQRFEKVDQRFEKVDQRFEKIDRRFDRVDQRFEKVDQRFDRVDQRFEKMDQRFENIVNQMANLRDWVELIAGRLQTRAGRNLENICAGALKLGLGRPDVKPENIRIRQKIKDVDGLMFKAGSKKEVDIWTHDGELLVFEVKSAPDPEDVDYFADKVELVRILNPDKTVKGVFIAVGVENDVREQCKMRNIQLIP